MSRSLSRERSGSSFFWGFSGEASLTSFTDSTFFTSTTVSLQVKKDKTKFKFLMSRFLWTINHKAYFQVFNKPCSILDNWFRCGSPWYFRLYHLLQWFGGQLHQWRWWTSCSWTEFTPGRVWQAAFSFSLCRGPSPWWWWPCLSSGNKRNNCLKVLLENSFIYKCFLLTFWGFWTGPSLSCLFPSCFHQPFLV